MKVFFHNILGAPPRNITYSKNNSKMPLKPSFDSNDNTINVYRILTDMMDDDSDYLNDFYSDYMVNETSSEKELKTYVEEKVLLLPINTIDYTDLLLMLIDYVKDILGHDFGDDTY